MRMSTVSRSFVARLGTPMHRRCCCFTASPARATCFGISSRFWPIASTLSRPTYRASANRRCLRGASSATHLITSPASLTVSRKWSACGLAPIKDFNPLLQMASGVYLTFFGSFVVGTPGFPLSDVPLQEIAQQAAAGKLKAKPSRVFGFEEIREAHRVMEAGEAGGKMVVVHGRRGDCPAHS